MESGSLYFPIPFGMRKVWLYIYEETDRADVKIWSGRLCLLFY